MRTCSICLGSLEPVQEAFLNDCFHCFCFKCILQWNEAQRAHPPAEGARYTCPLCKTAYTSIIHDCSDNSYRRHQVDDSANSSDGTAIALSFTQRLRRSVYFTAAATDQQPLTGQQLARLRDPSRLHKPELQKWVQRELQALLLEADVDLVVQHVLGTMQALAAPQPNHRKAAKRTAIMRPNPKLALPATAGTTSPNTAAVSAPQPVHPDHQQAWLAAIATAARPYLFGHAQRFASELVRFVALDVTVSTIDLLVFGEETMRHAQQAQIPGLERGGDTDAQDPRTNNQQQGPAHHDGDGYEQPASESSHSDPSESPSYAGHGDSDSDGYLDILLTAGKRRRVA
ncbi:hypothetical protein WJX72_005822 [[Myrmecia] bisecta]|uniref:RING-type domain-containing protein n=1 Tax=[Myrmecia] bisecta TaxID=41462 RepID=A0AAW1PDP7_9CHLO